MKAKLLFAGALALIFLACGQKPQSEGYTITGEIAGVTGKVYLTLFEGKMPQRIDSTEVVNGTFSFTGKQPLPMLASIDTPEHGAILRFFLENSPITITGSADAPDRISVLGSASEEMARKYRADIDSISEVFYSDSAAVSTCRPRLARKTDQCPAHGVRQSQSGKRGSGLCPLPRTLLLHAL